MGRDSVMPLLESPVLLDEMQVVASNDNSVLHLSGDYDTPK